MAKTRSKVTKRSPFGLNLEDDTGTYNAPSVTEANWVVSDAEITYDETFNERMDQLGQAIAGVPGFASADVKFTSELLGNGASGLPLLGKALQCCGLHLDTDTLTPLAGTQTGETASVAFWRDGRLKTAAGCAFNAVLKGESGKVSMVEFEGKGVRKTAVIDTAAPIPARPSVLPPVLMGATLSVGGSSLGVPDYELDLGVEVVERQDITDDYGILAYQPIPGVPKLTLKPEQLALSTRDWFNLYATSAELAFSLTIGSVANNKIIITAPAIQLVRDPRDEDDNGKLRDELEFQCNATDGTEGTALAIEFATA